jgi:hypothetical protein
MDKLQKESVRPVLSNIEGLEMNLNYRQGDLQAEVL